MEDRKRYSLIYLVYFAALSGFGTFRNVFLEDIGMTGVQMGVIGAVITVAATASQPFWGLVTDWMGAQREILVACAVVTGGAVLAYPLAPMTSAAFLVIFIGTSLYAVFHAPISPITDSLVLSTGLVYGKVRAFGSVAFGLGSLGYGFLIAELGSSLIFYVYSLGMVALVAVAWSIPEREENPIDAVGRDALALVTDRDFFLLILSAFLVGATLLPGNDFFSVYVRTIHETNANPVIGFLGVSADAVTGIGWFFLTLSEAAAFVYALRVTTRYKHLLVGGALAYAVKYVVYFLVSSPSLVVVSNLLTGVSFAAFYLSAVNLAHDIAPETLSSTSQTLLWTATFGVGASVGQLVAGSLVDTVGVGSMYGYLAVIATCGGVVALLIRSEARGETEGTAEKAGEFSK